MGRKAYMRKIQPKHQRGDVDPVRPDTALLFGAYCRSKGVVAAPIDSERGHLGRTERWVEALRRGDFIPTTHMAAQLDVHMWGDQLPTETFLSTLVELEVDPYGEQADRLRDDFGFPVYTGQTADLGLQVGDGLSPVATSVDERDRLLVTGPIMLVSGLWVLQLAVALWASGTIGELAVPVAAGLGSVVIVLLALLLRPVEIVLSFVANGARMPWCRPIYAATKENRRVAGIWEGNPGCWYQPSEAKHLLSNRREPAVRFALLADYAERVAILLVANLAGGLYLAASTRHDTFGGANAVVAAVVALGLVVAHVAAWNAAGWYEEQQTTGLGLEWDEFPAAS